MAGIGEPETDSLREQYHLAVFHRVEQSQSGLRVSSGVKRLRRLLAGPGKLSALIERVGFLNVRGIQQHDPQQLAGHVRGKDPAPESVFH